MPEIEKAVGRLTELEVGRHAWNVRYYPPDHTCSTPCALPRDGAKALEVCEQTDNKYRLILQYGVASLDWNRVLLVAVGRHRELEHTDDGLDVYGLSGVCGSCIVSAIFFDVPFSHGVDRAEWEKRADINPYEARTELEPIIRRSLEGQ